MSAMAMLNPLAKPVQTFWPQFTSNTHYYKNAHTSSHTRPHGLLLSTTNSSPHNTPTAKFCKRQQPNSANLPKRVDQELVACTPACCQTPILDGTCVHAQELSTAIHSSCRTTEVTGKQHPQRRK